MTILQAYLWGALIAYVIVSGEDDSAEGWVTGYITALWFVAVPVVAWAVLRRVRR